MLFNSYTFIYGFLPFACAIYFIARRFLPAWSNPVLALASLTFYSWWNINFLPLLLTSIVFNFSMGRLIGSALAAGRSRQADLWLWFGLTCNLGALVYFKYANFFLENAHMLGLWQGGLIHVALPLGISFITFQKIAYLVDVREGRSERYLFRDFALFVSFFPQLIAGPIVHHKDVMPQFGDSQHRKTPFEPYLLALGMTHFVAGLFKKVILADNLAPFATPVFKAVDAGGAISMFEAWGASLAYTLQLYFDFSGYSDMAIGLALMFGIRLPINFHSPYKATSIVDFWRRWHMTLSRFLRDYLYIPLGGNRKGPVRRYVNLFITMLLGGLWHGAGWGFIAWGALHGSYLVINHAWNALLPRAHGARRIETLLGWALTFLAVVIGWVFFRATTFSGAVAMLEAMFGVHGLSLPQSFAAQLGHLPGIGYASAGVIDPKSWALTGLPIIAIGALIAFFAPNTNEILLSQDSYYLSKEHGALRPPRWPALTWRPGIAQAAMTCAAFFVVVIYASNLSEFLYFQF